MKYAIVQIGNKQYRVQEGQDLVLDRQIQDQGQKVTFEDVILMVDGDKITLGSPNVKSAKVTAEIKDHHLGDKIRIAKFKSKSRYRRVNGYRHSHTTVSINKIS